MKCITILFIIMPGIVAFYFLFIGILVWLKAKQHSAHIAFSLLCLITFVWQLTWAILFQADSPEDATALIKVGYFLIIFLPTSLYHFLIEVSHSRSERKYVFLSYGVCIVFSVLLLTTDFFISGYYEYYWGYYPKAGVIHPLHVLQTLIVVSRGLYIAYQKQKTVSGSYKEQLRYCIGSLFVYFFAAADYACNYGFEFYPPGIIFIAISLSIIAYALLKIDLLNIQLVITRLSAHFIITTLVVITFLLINLPKNIPTEISISMNILAGLLWAKYGDHFRERLQTTTERKWVADWYDHDRVIQLLARRLTTSIDRKEIILSVTKTLREVISVSYSYTLIKNESDYDSYSNDIKMNHSALKSASLVKHLESPPFQVVFCSELPAVVMADNDLALSKNGILLSLHSSSGLEGIIILGKRVSEARYSSEDRRFFETVARQVDVFLDRAETHNRLILETTDQHEKKLEQTKSVAGNIAHELRTPLINITMATKTIDKYWSKILAGYELGRKMSENNKDIEYPIVSSYRLEGIRSGTASISRSAKRAQTIIAMLLENVRNEQINTSDFDDYSISSCLQRALDDYPFQGREKQLVEFSTKNNFNFHGSDALLIYVMFNLIENSFYYIAKSGSGNIRIWLEQGSTTNTLHFRDTGIGIKSDVISNIFDPFFTTKPARVGNGLGLPFCRRVIESFAGSIRCESSFGEYTEFTIQLPRLIAHTL